MGQRIAVQKQQWWPITAMAQANLRAAGLDVGQRKAGHDFHGLSPCRFYGGEALAGRPAEAGRAERRNSGTSPSDGWAVPRQPRLSDIACLARVEPPSAMHCRA